MKPTLTIHQATGHPFWQEAMHTLTLNGRALNIPRMLVECGAWYASYEGKELFRDPSSITNWKIFESGDGIYGQPCSCSSGGGRHPSGRPVKILDRQEYGIVEWDGSPMEAFREDLSERAMLGPDFRT